jgi:hypothetical protein
MRAGAFTPITTLAVVRSAYPNPRLSVSTRTVAGSRRTIEDRHDK